MTAITEIKEEDDVPVSLQKVPDQKKFSFSEFKLEIQRIEWPSRKDVARSTSAVLIILVTFVIFVVVVDAGFSKFIQLIQLAK